MATATFFEHQHLARRNTRVMVALFLLAVVAVVFAVDLVIATLYIWNLNTPLVLPAGTKPGVMVVYGHVPGKVYFLGAAVTAGVIFVVSIVNMLKLSGGGAAVAEMVGAQRLAPATRDALERRLLNVVEEMAIAAGVRVPAVYVMDDERGINAFAAGYDVSNSVITVTRGTLETLTRDELQGVIGHEFSHIVNGDMRLNIRMIGVLAGIVFIGSVGHFVMRSVRGSERGKGGSLVLIGLALFIIGYVGLFFARLIKAAVSRQREFLADASSVQFTRNPEGIAGALDQIGRSTGLIANRYAEDMAHMFFGQGIQVWLGSLFDTHPPLEERIRRVCPGFQPSAYRSKREMAPPPVAAGGEEAFGRTAGFAGGSAAPATEGRRSADISTAWGRSAGQSAALVGTMDSNKVDYAVRLLASLPAPLREGLRDTGSALAIVVSLLLAPNDDVMAQQLEALQGAGLEKLAGGARAVAPLTRRLGPAFHLAVLDLALPAVKLAPESQKIDLVKALQLAIHADRRVSLHEFVVLTLVRHQLAARKGAGAVTRRKLAEMRPEALTVLGLLAHAGVRADATGEREQQLLQAMRAGMQAMGLDGEPGRAPELALDDAVRALGELKQLAPLQKAIAVKGLFAAVSVDGSIRVDEAELMRLVGAVLDCPLPPLLESLDPATLAA